MASAVRVTKLAHVELAVENTDRSTEFYNDRWGLDVAEEHAGCRYLRADGPDAHALVLSEGRPSVGHVAFAVASPDDLKRAEDALGEQGVALLGAQEQREPGVGESIRFLDPNGLVVELLVEGEETRPDYGPRAVKPRGLDHVVLKVSDFEGSIAFYRDVLGFRLSDQTADVMAFLRCNANHHSLALIRSDQASMHHLAFKVDDWGTLADGVKYLGDAGVCRLWGPGRHGPGDNLFAYFTDPDGHIVEYTCEVLQILDEESWVPQVWPLGRPEKWGTPMPPEMR